MSLNNEVARGFITSGTIAPVVHSKLYTRRKRRAHLSQASTQVFIVSLEQTEIHQRFADLPDTELISAQDLVPFLPFAYCTLARKVSDGEFPAMTKIGVSNYFNVAELRSWSAGRVFRDVA